MQTQLERLLEKLTRIEQMHAATKAAILAITEPRSDPFLGVPLTTRNRAKGWRESPCAQNWEQTTNGYSCAELAEMGDV